MKAFTLVEALVAAAIVGILGAILLPVLSAERGKHPNPNSRRIALASLLYSEEHDQWIVPTINGPWGALANIRDGELTDGTLPTVGGSPAGLKRTDMWPLILFPYLRNRQFFIDPQRGDRDGVWSGPPKARTDAGFDQIRNSFRTQNRFPMYGVNYMFLSPMVKDPRRSNEPKSTDYAVSRPGNLLRAIEPGQTVFYLESRYFASNEHRGYFGVNAPGMWTTFSKDDSPFIVHWNGTDGSGDWCFDSEPTVSGRQRGTSSAYVNHDGGANVAFLDGHMAYMKDAEIAAGTNYLQAKPVPVNGVTGPNSGGTVINDRSKYIWDLDSEL